MLRNLLLMILMYFRIMLVVGIIVCFWSFIFEKRIKKNLAYYDNGSIDDFPDYISLKVYFYLILTSLIPIFNLILLWLIPLGLLDFEKIRFKK